MIFAELLSLAKKIQIFQADATSGGLWTDTTHFTTVCPSGKRWFFMGGVVNRSANATLLARLMSGGYPALILTTDVAATGISTFPNTVASVGNWHFSGVLPILDAGDNITLTFGAAQGAGAYCILTILEIDV